MPDIFLFYTATKTFSYMSTSMEKEDDGDHSVICNFFIIYYYFTQCALSAWLLKLDGVLEN